ncbi:MAG TPA: hypothetical protein VLJ79_07190 [Candidatus Binatia bacterium]|nr:hypothetical protein [Candidatus Binatia bacterium]
MVVAMAMAVPIFAGVMIVDVRVLVRYRERGLFKEMMNPMGYRGHEKKSKEGNDPQGADGAKIVKDFFHGVADYLYFWLNAF